MMPSPQYPPIQWPNVWCPRTLVRERDEGCGHPEPQTPVAVAAEDEPVEHRGEREEQHARDVGAEELKGMLIMMVVTL